jgi:hypothetical protein
MIDDTDLTPETGADAGGTRAGGPRRRWMVATELPGVDWQTDTSGTIGPEAIEFTATLGSDGRWDVNILAC